MKPITIFLIIFCLGCNHTVQLNQGEEKLWETELNDKIDQIEQLNNQFTALNKELAKRSRLDPVPVEYYGLSIEIEGGIYELWSLSRCCLFLDIDSKKLTQNVSLILHRYRNYLDKNKHIGYDEITLLNMKSNIDALDSWYYIHAIHVIQDCIWFDERLYSTSNRPYIPKDGNKRQEIEQQRVLAKKAMEQWYDKNMKDLYWMENFRKFENAEGDDKIPVEVVNLFNVD